MVLNGWVLKSWLLMPAGSSRWISVHWPSRVRAGNRLEKRIRRARLCGVRELIHAINEDLDAHNDNRRPFVRDLCGINQGEIEFTREKHPSLRFRVPAFLLIRLNGPHRRLIGILRPKVFTT
jgi:hypothetical protein